MEGRVFDAQVVLSPPDSPVGKQLSQYVCVRYEISRPLGEKLGLPASRRSLDEHTRDTESAERLSRTALGFAGHATSRSDGRCHFEDLSKWQ